MTPGLLFLTPLANGQHGLIYPKFQIGILHAGKQMGQVRLEASEAIRTDPGSNQRRSSFYHSKITSCRPFAGMFGEKWIV